MTNGAGEATGSCTRASAEPAPARIFVGVKVADDVAQQLTELARPLERQGARLVARRDIHLTLVPPWSETQVKAAIERLPEAASIFGGFPLTFAHLAYGPTARHPRLLWVGCVAGDELTKLRCTLLNAYGQIDARQFVPHVTLARIPHHGRAVARDNPIARTLSLTQYVTSVELFQSPRKGESGYRVLASSLLGKDPSASTALPGDTPHD